MVPSEVRDAITTGNPMRRIRSIIVSVSLIGHERAARAFDDPRTMRRGDRCNRRPRQRFEANANARFTRGQMRRNRRLEEVRFAQNSLVADFRQAAHRVAVGTFDGTGLNRLPIIRVERGDEKRRQHRLADVGVRTGDERIRVMARPAPLATAARVRQRRRSIAAANSRSTLPACVAR